MSNQNIRISDEDYEKLEQIKENYYEHTTLTYGECISVLIAEYESDNSVDDSDEGSVTRSNAGGDDESTEDDNFQTGGDGLSAEERVRRVRVDE